MKPPKSEETPYLRAMRSVTTWGVLLGALLFPLALDSRFPLNLPGVNQAIVAWAWLATGAPPPSRVRPASPRASLATAARKLEQSALDRRARRQHEADLALDDAKIELLLAPSFAYFANRPKGSIMTIEYSRPRQMSGPSYRFRFEGSNVTVEEVLRKARPGRPPQEFGTVTLTQAELDEFDLLIAYYRLVPAVRSSGMAQIRVTLSTADHYELRSETFIDESYLYVNVDLPLGFAPILERASEACR